MYEDGTVTDLMCKKWCVKFCAGDFLLCHAPLLGDSDQIETLIDDNQCYTTWEIDELLKISKSIKILVLVKMKKYVFYFTEINHMDFLVNPIFFK